MVGLMEVMSNSAVTKKNIYIQIICHFSLCTRIHSFRYGSVVFLTED
jgi:hypothetical protein